MEELARKLERLVQARAINIETREGGKVRHRGCRLLPLGGTEPGVGDLCRSVVVGKDEGRRELIVHVTFLLEGDRSVFVNHLGLRGYIRDYDLKEEFSIFTYLGNYKQVALGSELIAQVHAVVVREEKKHFELTLKVGRQHRQGPFRAGVGKDQSDPAPREWRLLEKFGYFPANFLAQYEEDFANPGLLVRLCRDGRVQEGESLDSSSLAGALAGLALDYERLIFAPGEAVGGQALPRRTQTAEIAAARPRPRTPNHRPQLRQGQCQDPHRPRLRLRQSQQLQRGPPRHQGRPPPRTPQHGSPPLP